MATPGYPPAPPPPDLPPGWARATDASGRPYYFHTSGAIQWHAPSPSSAPPPPPPPPPPPEDASAPPASRVDSRPGPPPAHAAVASYRPPPAAPYAPYDAHNGAPAHRHSAAPPPPYDARPAYDPLHAQPPPPAGAYAPPAPPPHAPGYPPAPPPPHAPSYAPAHAPSYAPAHAPSYPHHAPSYNHAAPAPAAYPSARPDYPSPAHPHSLPLPPPAHPHAPAPAPAVSALTAHMTSLAVGPGAPVVPISLEFRAAALKNRDLVGRSDPLLHVCVPADAALVEGPVAAWRRVASTEVLSNTTSPAWATRVKLPFHFERHQPLRFDLVDVDNRKTLRGDDLGSAHVTLADAVRNGVVRLPLRREGRPGDCGELTVRAHDDNAPGRVRLKLSLAATNLDKKDFMGKSDPYYKLLHVVPGAAGTSTLHKSNEVMNDCNPTWAPHTTVLSTHGAPWSTVQLNVTVYDWDKYTPHDLIGEAAFSLTDLTQASSFPLVNRKKKAKKGARYKDSGQLIVHRADAVELPSFISYLQGGLRLDFFVAVDFTASNRPVDNPASLHYMGDPHRPSQYYQALHAIGTILVGYVPDQYITALGFGAQLPGQGSEAAFDFALTGQPDPRVHGVQGLLNAYTTAVTSVTLAGPTYFVPIIRNAMATCAANPVSQTNQHFCVLLMLTDGIITDLAATIDTIIDASHSTPIAIVIVGIGDANFSAMERLDADNHKLKSDHGGKEAKHDIVQFTHYDPAKPIDALAADVLQEVPSRVVEYMVDAGITPNAPAPPAHPPI